MHGVNVINVKSVNLLNFFGELGTSSECEQFGTNGTIGIPSGLRDFREHVKYEKDHIIHHTRRIHK